MTTRRLRIEFYGVARARAGRDHVEVDVPPAATLADALAALAAAVPDLVGSVLAADGRALAAGSLASLDGKEFTRDPAHALPTDGALLLVPSSAGG